MNTVQLICFFSILSGTQNVLIHFQMNVLFFLHNTCTDVLLVSPWCVSFSQEAARLGGRTAPCTVLSVCLLWLLSYEQEPGLRHQKNPWAKSLLQRSHPEVFVLLVFALFNTTLKLYYLRLSIMHTLYL